MQTEVQVNSMCHHHYIFFQAAKLTILPFPFKTLANKPKAVVTQYPSVEKMYIGESVSLGCKVDVSSGWEYQWYKDETPLSDSSNSYNISSATSSDSGIYKCIAKRGTTTAFNTDYSDTLTLQISGEPNKMYSVISVFFMLTCVYHLNGYI